MNALWRDPGLVVVDRWQRGFPLVPRPFAEIGAAHDLSEAETLNALARLQDRGILSRVGAIVRPNTAGASTLAALSCKPDRLDRIARLVSAETFVTHNYERDHHINLWFVIAAPTEAELAGTLQSIARGTACEVIDLRLQRSYYIDLGFGLGAHRPKQADICCASRLANARERILLAAIEDGLLLVPRPFEAAGRILGWREADILAGLKAMLEDGIVTRFGCIVRHRAVGFTANAMAVWDVPDSTVDEVGRKLAREGGVTLCYRRNRQIPHWRYNLFAMIHGCDEGLVRQRILEIADANGLGIFPSAILFSRRCFAQRGARFASRPREAAA